MELRLVGLFFINGVASDEGVSLTRLADKEAQVYTDTMKLMTWSDNDNDGLLSSGDTYRIETNTDTAGLSVVFYDVVAGVEVVSVREAIALRGVCNCIAAPAGWHLDPDPSTNSCVTCTSSSDCSAAGCVLLKDSNPLITMAQGCYWSTVYSVGKAAHEPADVQAVE